MPEPEHGAATMRDREKVRLLRALILARKKCGDGYSIENVPFIEFFRDSSVYDEWVRSQDEDMAIRDWNTFQSY